MINKINFKMFLKEKKLSIFHYAILEIIVEDGNFFDYIQAIENIDNILNDLKENNLLLLEEDKWYPTKLGRAYVEYANKKDLEVVLDKYNSLRKELLGLNTTIKGTSDGSLIIARLKEFNLETVLKVMEIQFHDALKGWKERINYLGLKNIFKKEGFENWLDKEYLLSQPTPAQQKTSNLI